MGPLSEHAIPSLLFSLAEGDFHITSSQVHLTNKSVPLLLP